MTSDSSITVKLIYNNYDKEKQIKKKVIMNVQLKTFSSILLLLGTHLSDDLWSRKVSSEQHEKVVLKKVSLIEHS